MEQNFNVRVNLNSKESKTTFEPAIIQSFSNVSKSEDFCFEESINFQTN